MEKTYPPEQRRVGVTVPSQRKVKQLFNLAHALGQALAVGQNFNNSRDL